MDAQTATFTLEPGAPVPDFDELPGTDGKRYTLSSFADDRLLVMVFTSNGCPTVRAYQDRLAALHRRYADQGVRLIAVNSNNPHLSPGDSLEEMIRRAEAEEFPYIYLKDADGALARAVGAICTPHAFLFDDQRRLAYQGRVDDARVSGSVTSPDLEHAIAKLLSGKAPAVAATEPFGCAIVW
ncbi:MAG: thioredoxin family protein [Actinomycetota bacterium]